MKQLVAITLACGLFGSCSGGSATPVAPTPVASPPAPAPTLRLLELSPPSGTLRVGDRVPILVWAGYSDGNFRYVSANWSTSNSAVATMSSNGFITGVGPGTATITASVLGQSTSGTFTINARLTGFWSGGFLVNSCTGTGSNSDVFCTPGRGLTQSGTTTSGSLDLVDNGSSVSGVMTFGGVRGPVSGVVVNGLMTLQGSLTLSGGPTLAITHWSTDVQVNQITGFVSFEARYPQFAGVAIIRTSPSGLTQR